MKRPNIVLILADDMGFSDAGCYGGEIRTPNLDRLAAEGIRFSRFYNCALCGPSRASLMTGLYHHQAGIAASWTGLLSNRCVTIPELLNRAGYLTGAVGRLDMLTADDWHDPAMILRHVPRFLGSTGHKGPGNYFKAVRDSSFCRDGQPFELPIDGCYKTDLITDYAARFIGEAARGGKPFFLYVAHYAPHWPLHAKPEDIAKYRDTYRAAGWDQLRAQRHKRLAEAGLTDPKWALSPRDPQVPPWERAANKPWEAERMAAYAAQVDCMDQGIGRLLAAVRDGGVEQNTLVMFLSDNGASHQAWERPLDQKGSTWRRDGTPTRVGNRPDIQPGLPDTFVTGGPPWANVSNTPFRQYKATNYEGGIATPLIVRWPDAIRKGGAITHQAGHIMDLMPTCLDAAGVEYPEALFGRAVLPLEGRSLLPVLQGKTREGHEALCWDLAGNRAVQMGNWKLVALKGRPWELYDMEADRTETRNLAAEQPKRVAEMAAAYNRWAKRVGATPST
ncbi:MAG TPA: arylsulfatase [Planctomycetota bacterium]|nr:arylsulfatase [Planctomycetota bacterium]